ncbi:MAG: ABC transporter permease, partial [Planctomycetota bacterium]|nr:ABC transporter permease [Planctomycetota bacterium]
SPGAGPWVAAVTPDFFATTGTALLRGRLFTAADRAGSERVAIVNEAMTRTLWPRQEALGQCLVIFSDSLPCARVVGVVRTSRQWGLQEAPVMQYYVPLGQEVRIRGLELLVRPRGDHPERVADLVRREFWAIRPDLPYARVTLLDEALSGDVRPWRLGASLFTLFGLLALVVTVVGLYGVVACVVEQHNREYAVRIALGARPGHVFAQTLRRGLAPAVLGLPVGVAIALLAGRFVEPLLFETSPRDIRVLALVALTLLAVSALASLVPALRAMRVDPVVALQAE